MIRSIKKWLKTHRSRSGPAAGVGNEWLPQPVRLGNYYFPGPHYEYGAHLLHASHRFLGVLSAASIAVPPPPQTTGTAWTQSTFVLGDEWFTIELSVFRASASSGRGHRRVDVYRNDKRLFFEERGCSGLAAEYVLGDSVFMEGNRAYEIVPGRALFSQQTRVPAWPHLDPESYHLLRYDEMVIPAQQKLTDCCLPPKESYRRRELLPLRQAVWTARLESSMLGPVSVEHSEVRGFYQDVLRVDRTHFQANKWKSCLERRVLAIGEQVFVFE